MSRLPESRKPVDLSDLEDELKATMAARRELTPEMENALIGNFLQQIEKRIDAHIEQRLTDNSRGRADRQKQMTALVSSILGISIPLVVLAGAFGGGQAILAVCALVLIVSLAALFRA
jgi:hypothetical protein